SELPAEPQPDPSPAHTNEVHMDQQTDPSPRPSPSHIILDSILDSSGGNLGGYSSSNKSLSGNEGEMTLQSSMDAQCLLEAKIGKKEILKETMGAHRVFKPKQFLERKEKGVELKDIEETDIPRPTSTRSLLTLKLLASIY
ncbi:hypothetical protein Tco_0058627, partial [Tanacetum coccineum]